MKIGWDARAPNQDIDNEVYQMPILEKLLDMGRWKLDTAEGEA